MVKRIEDAQYAIYANSATGVKVLSNTFERNWVVARLVQKTANPAATHVFRGNLFFGNVLKPPFSGQAPLPGTHSFAGIWASSIPYVWLGDGSNSPNTALNRFVDLRIGIISNKSVFSVNRTSFETIIDAGIVEGYQTGIGILAEASSYIVYAISPKDHYIRIYNNRFDNTNTGILTINAVYAERSATGDDKINDNYIYSSTISGASLIAPMTW
ncbi:MAG: hypothetical protein ACRBG0_13485 [Lewinella sp.]|jgi:hypothetical protein|uniref:hypothetical protein n=1 Tax=Lewinella sp. TaxID=2004506 RepID=UPI003D6C5229